MKGGKGIKMAPADVYLELYWEDIEEGVDALPDVAERCSGLVATWEFPADLAVGLQHVDSLEGPGWHKYREEHESVIFFEEWVGLDDLTEESAAERVRAASEIIDQTVGLWADYEIAGGRACGEKGNEVTCYAVYSRPRGAGEERNWSWRYVVCPEQFGTHVFENMAELLEWYKSYSEPREEDWSVSVEGSVSGVNFNWLP
ncbi:hypothetical protein F5Y06DRAFT_301349 [Hypoxylon sp. FL0890]|nr:hypothetical protein F5Y06DRAFT_301349 [Hypoxylon sp. FL0890]